MVQTQLPGGFLHPFSPAARQDPYPALAWLRENAPLFRDQHSGMYYATDHESVTQILRDRRFSAAGGQLERDRDQPLPPLMLNTDPPEHQRLRAPGLLLLGPAAVAEHLGAIADEATALLDALAARGEAEVASELGEPFATLVLATVLRIPPGDRAMFTALARQASVNLDPTAGPAATRAGTRAAALITRYLDGNTDRVTAAGVDAPLARLAADPRLSRAEMLGILSLTVIGGFEPLASLIGNALTWLLPRPDALAELRDADQVSAERAVDELLRLESPIPFVARVVAEPVALAGGLLAPGDRVLAMLAAANRDPAVFARPDDLVLSRTPNPHLAFGGGGHFCLAGPLVRTAGAVLLRELAGRFPAARRADGGRPEWSDRLLPRRVRRLRVVLD
jgi:pimeloyl-[acyl-carrier protein] synthase